MLSRTDKHREGTYYVPLWDSSGSGSDSKSESESESKSPSESVMIVRLSWRTMSADGRNRAGNGGGYMPGNTVLMMMWFKTDFGGPRVSLLK